jgi:hypothetical protein
LYWTAKRRSSRRLAVASLSFFGYRTPLLSAGLLLAAPQIFAQRPSQALLARRAFSVVFCAGLWRLRHPAMQREGVGHVKPVSYSSIRIFACAARITATACFAAYSAD